MAGTDEAELHRLLRAAITGDEKAYAAFLNRVAGLVRGYCRRRIVMGTVDVEDIVQETLLAIHIKRHTWRDDAPVLPWIYAIARFKMTDAFRKRGSRVQIDVADLADTLPAPESETARQSLSQTEMDRVLGVLPTGQKAAVAAISVEGLSIPETAARLGLTEAAVRVALHRGLAAISKRFGRNF